MDPCPAFASGMGYAPDVLAMLDCKTEALARLGFGAFATSGSPAMVAIGGMMTLLVAFYGYRLLLGGRLDLGDAIVTMVKIGLVLSCATQWPAYQTVFYDVAVKGPQELLARLPFDILDDPAHYPGRLQASYDRLAALEIPRPIVSAGTVAAPPASDPYAAAGLPPARDVTYGDLLSFRPMSAGLFLLVSSLTALALPRLVAGMLLALGPLFIGFLLFDATRSIFLGWVRVLAWSIIAGTIVTVIFGIELSVVEPQIATFIADLASGAPGLPKTGELIATTLFFACLLLGALVAAIAPTRLSSFIVRVSPTGSSGDSRVHLSDRSSAIAAPAHNVAESSRSRARLIADRMALTAETQERTRQLRMVGGPHPVGERTAGRLRSDVVSPLGQSYRRTAPAKRMISPARRENRK